MSRCTNSISCHHDPACEDVGCQGRPEAAPQWRIVGEQHVKDSDGTIIQVTAGEAKMLSRLGAIVRTEAESVWAIASDWDYDAIQDTLSAAASEAAEDRELRGIPDDTPSIANCNDWGSGEGRFHGRM